MVTTLLARRAQFHHVHLASHARPADATFTQAVTALAAHLHALGLDAAAATRQAYALLYRGLVAQATTLAYIDTFQVLAWGAGAMALLSFALRRNEPGGAPVPAH
jgi:MFS transporter, DHA2 family, multidrug resistance protein